MKYRIFIRKLSKNIKSLDTVLIILMILFSFLDFINIDAKAYFHLCSFFNSGKNTFPCTNFYDIKYWEGLVAIGTISATYFAYKSLRQSNKNLTANQMPFIVFYDRIIVVNRKVHSISVKNIGRGLAHNITVSLWPFDNRKSIVDKSNPEVIHLGIGEANNSWALENTEFIKQLRNDTYKGRNIYEMIKDETSNDEPTTFKLYARYYDSYDNEYVTESIFKRFGDFVKVVKSDYWGPREF